jgi:2-dehydro-3-deoxygluconokinase
MLGNEEDFTAALGFEVEGIDENLSGLDPENFRRMIERAVKEFPNFSVVATTLRNARTATVNDWGAVCHHEGKLYQAASREGLEILDRVGGGDSFASGLIYGFLSGKGAQWAVECGCRPRRPGHDHAGRHDHGHARRGVARDEGRRGAGGEIKT